MAYDDLILGDDGAEETTPFVSPDLVADRDALKGTKIPKINFGADDEVVETATDFSARSRKPINFGADDEVVGPAPKAARKRKTPKINFGANDEVVGAVPMKNPPLPMERPPEADVLTGPIPLPMARPAEADALTGPIPLPTARPPGADVPGMIERGNIDLNNRPIVPNGNGYSTVRSASFDIDGKETLLPTVSDDGRLLSEDEAIEQYRRTGKHLGKFDSPQSATAYGKKLHNDQEAQYGAKAAARYPAAEDPMTAGLPDQLSPVQPLDDAPFRSIMGGERVKGENPADVGRAGMLTGEQAWAERQSNIKSAEAEVEDARARLEAARRRSSEITDRSGLTQRRGTTGYLQWQAIQDEVASATENLAQAERALAAAERAAPPTMTKLRDAAARLAATVGQIVPDTVGGLARPLDAGLDALGIKDGTGTAEKMREFSKNISKANPSDITREDELSAKLGQGAGSAIGFMLTGVVGRAAGLSAALTSGVTGAAQNAEQYYREADDMGASAMKKAIAYVTGGLIGSTEAFGLGRFGDVIEGMNKATGGAVRRYFGLIMKEKGEEGLQEGVQQLLENIAKYGLYGKDPGDITANVASNALVGAMLGGGMAAIGGVPILLGGRKSDAGVPQPSQEQITTEEIVRQILGQPPTPPKAETDKTDKTPEQTGDKPSTGENITTSPDDVVVPAAVPISKNQPQTTIRNEGENVAAPADAVPVSKNQPQTTIRNEAENVAAPAASTPSAENQSGLGAVPVKKQNDETAALLRGYGYTDDQIADMSPAQQEREAAAAREAGTEPIEAPALQRAVEAASEPHTPAQAEANNRKLGHYSWNGLDASIEAGPGQARKWLNKKTGATGQTTSPATMGYFKGTVGGDGQHLDVYFGPSPESQNVWMVDELDRDTGKWRQHKVMAGFNTEAEARAAYLGTTGKSPKTLGAITPMTVEGLKDWMSKPGNLKKALVNTKAVTPPKETKSDKPLSLLQFIASKGGVRPDPELTAIGLTGGKRMQIPGRKGFFGVVRPTGMSLDQMREAAEEAGYFRGTGNATSTIREFLDAIDAEERGQKKMAEGFEAYIDDDTISRIEDQNANRNALLAQNRAEIEEMLADVGVPVSDRETEKAKADIALAAEIMADEGLGPDEALERAAIRNGEADPDIPEQNIYDAFGDTDAVQPPATQEDERPAATTSSERERPEEKSGAKGQGVDLPSAGEDRGRPGESKTDEATAGGARSGEEVSDEVGAKDSKPNRQPETDDPFAADRAALPTFKKGDKVEFTQPGEFRQPDGSLKEGRLVQGVVTGINSKSQGILAVQENGKGDWTVRASRLRKTETGADGKDQLVIPGAEKESDGKQAQRKADEKLKPSVTQKPADEGLFGDDSKQTDLLDLTKPRESGVSDSEEAGTAAPEKPTVPDFVSYRVDNPGGQWLTQKQEDARENRKYTNGTPTAFLRGKGKKQVSLPTDLLAKVPGLNDERRAPGDLQYDSLLSAVKKEGWSNEHPILIRVTHLGKPYILEGNTRVAVAKAIGQSTVPVWVDWMNGAEQTPGPWNPANILPQATMPNIEVDSALVQSTSTTEELEATQGAPKKRKNSKDQRGTVGENKPESEIKPKEEEKEKVEAVGEKLGGARREKWIGKGLDLEDIADMSEEDKVEYITKHNVWQKPDWVQAVADGVDPTAVALIKRIYDRISVKPNHARIGDSPATVRNNFIKTLAAARNIYGEAKTVDDVIKANTKLSAELGSSSYRMIETVQSKNTHYSPFFVSGADKRSAERAVKNGFPNAPLWTRLFIVQERNKSQFENGKWVSEGREYAVWRKNGGVIGRFETRELAEAAAQAAYEKVPEERKKGGEMPERPHLDTVERTGPDYRKGKDITAQNLMDTFGFRGVDFGNWAANDERQKLVNLGFEALHDLARVLGIPAKAISLNGSLGIAFGSHGRGGKGAGAAHYQPQNAVINMTKMHGAGSLAHEWGHALDDYLGTPVGKMGLSGGRVAPQEQYLKQGNFLDYKPQLPKKLRQAANKLMHDIYVVVEQDEAAIERLDKEILDKQRSRESWISHAKREKQNKNRVSKKTEDAIAWFDRALERLEKQREQGIERRSIKSEFVKNAEKISGPTGEYWQRPEELFARSWEAFVFDKIAAEGFKSQYLVQGVEESRFGEGFRGNPYPAGAERKTLNADYERLLKALRTGEGRHGAGTRLESDEGDPEPITTSTKVFRPKPVEDPSKPKTLHDAFEGYFGTGQGFEGILQARKFAKDAGFEADAKEVEEALEFAVVKVARGIVDSTPTEDVYKELVDLYNRQPKLGTRTSTSVRDQAYSTPIPLAYIASRLANITKNTTVYEPTAGNGALLIAANPKQVYANEINKDRAKNLRAQGYFTDESDATKEFPGKPGSYDRVIANPPFGAVRQEGESTVYDMSDIQPGYETKEVDHVIALNALEAMDMDGKAVLILGGINKLAKTQEARSDAYNNKAKREFFKVLYDRYTVTDHFTVDGDLYERQGAGWPVDVIVIDGNGKSARALPAVDVPRVYSSWTDLGGLLDDLQPSAGNARPDAGANERPVGERPELGGSSLGSGGSAVGGGDTSGRNLQQPAGVLPGAVSGERSEPVGEGSNQPQAKPGRDDLADRPDTERAGELTADEIGAAFDDIMGGKPAAKPATPRKPSGPRTTTTSQPRTTPEVAKSAASNAVAAADNAMSALTTLFGGGKTIGAGLSFDEDTYRKAKPLFRQAAEKYADFKRDIVELMRRMVDDLRSAYGWTDAMLTEARDYIVRFMQDVQSGVVNLYDAIVEEAKPITTVQRTHTGTAEETEHQSTYRPQSKAPPLDTLTPINMREPTGRSLQALEDRVGDLDTFVTEELGYKDANELWQQVGAEQVDALALAIDNLKRGSGFIIGDQTGIGKGRVNAVIIRWAMKNGKIPIFVTEKPGLYKDMYRDMTDTGMTAYLGHPPRILATNSPLNLPLEDTGSAKLTTGGVKEHVAVMQKAIDNFDADWDMVFTTYNQLQTVKGEDTARRQFIEAISPRAIVIFDESHNGGGQEAKRGKKESDAVGRAGFARGLVANSAGVFYSSATYAKRPDVMDLYSKTNMSMAVDDITKLGELISRGGVPMQQVVAAKLAEDGQYIRRERSFAGIEYKTLQVSVERDRYNDIASGLYAIHEFSEAVKETTKRINKNLKSEGGTTGFDNATGDAGAASTNFTAIMHNVVNQMLLAMKAEPAAKEAIEAIKAGKKPVLTVSNTMEAMIESYIAPEIDEDGNVTYPGIKQGEVIDADFSDVLHRYLERTRVITIKEAFSKKGEHIKKRLTDEELGYDGLAAYNEAKSIINRMNLTDLPMSPIDHIIGRLKKEGYSVGEITGRGITIDYTGKEPVLGSRGTAETSVKGRNETLRKFNTRPSKGGHHALILNQAGSTGLSAHASEKFDDKSPRHMFIVQPEADINTHMQLLGRINRTGQVVLPTYTQIAADIPAETRPLAVLSKKMASLNANTTASRKSAVTATDTPDFMNQYGDEVAVNYLRDNPLLNAQLGWPLKPNEAGELPSDDAMRKLTGRLPLRPLLEQEEHYKNLIEEYDALLEQINASGGNALEAKSLDLKAKTLEISEVQGAKNNSGSAFAAPVNIEKVSVARLGKPYTPNVLLDKIGKRIDAEVESLGGNLTLDQLAEMFRAIDDPYNILGKKVSKIETDERQEMLAAFAKYTNPLLDETDENEERVKLTQKFNAQKDRWTEMHQIMKIGRRVTLRTANGNLSAIVLDVSPKSDTKNPLALGSWKATFAIADASRQMIVPFGRLYPEGRANPESMLDIEVVPTQTWIESPRQTLERFLHGQNEAREERYIATGNILAAYDWLNHKGAIINYTDFKGNINQGILTPKTFDLSKHAIAKGRVVTNPAEIKAWMDENVGKEVSTKDGTVAISKQKRWSDDYQIQTSKSKRIGGIYFLDKTLTRLTGDFYTRGNKMTGEIGSRNLAEAIGRLQQLGAIFTLPTTAPKATKVETPEMEASIRSTKNNATFKGQRFWSGAFDPIDGTILETHTYEKAKRADFHHSHYFSGRMQEAMREGRAQFFWIDDNGKVQTEWRESEAKPEIIRAIERQITLEASIARIGPATTAPAITPEKRAAVEAALTDVVSKMTGGSVQVKFVDKINLEGGASPAWGSYGEGITTAAGGYVRAESLIYLAMADPAYPLKQTLDTTFHEVFHHLENQLLTDQEMEVLKREDGRLRQLVQKVFGFNNAQVKGIAGHEIRAMAFEYYAHRRARGFDPQGLHIGIRRAFERLMELFRRVRNALAGLGYQSADDIFQSAFDGAYASRTPMAEGRGFSLDPELQANIRQVRPEGNLNRFESYDPLPENWRDWWKRPDLNWRDRVWGMIDAALLKTNRALGDRYVDMRRMQAAVEATGRKVGEGINMALSAVLFEGKTEKRLKDYWLKTWRPVLDYAAEQGISRQDLHKYLYARHAPERNAQIAKINPAMPEGGSGMTDEEAQEIMEGFQAAGKREALERVAQRVDAIVRSIRQNMINDQLEHEETIAKWEQTYQYYVPLRGWESGDEDMAQEMQAYRTGKGFDVRGPETRSALGRSSKADDVLSNLFLQGERAIIRGEQNRVGRTAMRFMQSNPHPDLYDVARTDRVLSDRREETITENDIDLLKGERPITIRRVNRETGLVETVTRVANAYSKNSFAVKVGGHTYYIIIKHPGLLTALTNLGVQRLPWAIQAHGWLTRQFAAFRTARNPDFFVANLFRDVQDAAYTINAEQRTALLRHFAVNIGSLRTYIAAAMGEAMEADNAIGRLARKNLGDKRLAALFEDWKKQGGQIAFMGISDFEQAKKEIERAFHQGKRNIATRVAMGVARSPVSLLRAIEYFNAMIEGGTRLAVYDAALKAGMTKAMAAQLSKEATTNFNRKGIYSPYINSFYAFFNARVQGAVKNIRLLRNSKMARRAAIGLVIAGFATTLWNLAVSPDDEDKKPEYMRRKYWERERYFIIYMPGSKEPFRMPMGYGLQLFWMLGENLAMLSQGKISPAQAAANYLSTIVSAFSPLQAEGSPMDIGTWLRTIMPSIEMPALELATNENWQRKPIHPKFEQRGLPHSEQYFTTTSPYAIDVAQFLNRATGGHGFKRGKLDLYPGDLQYVWNFIAGGLGQTVTRTDRLLENWMEGVPTPPNQVPILRHFVGATVEQTVGESYYEDRDAVQKGMAAYRKAGKAPASNDAAAMMEEGANKYGAGPGKRKGTVTSEAEQIFRAADKELKELREKERAARNDRSMSRAAREQLIKNIRENMRQIQQETRQKYKAIQKEEL